jgi:hypothetical protein
MVKCVFRFEATGRQRVEKADGLPKRKPPVPYGTIAALGSLASVALSSAKAGTIYTYMPVAVKR